jgi:hypothetical protein
MATDYVQHLMQLEQGKKSFNGRVVRRLLCGRMCDRCVCFCVAEEARLKIQYSVIGEQLKAVKAKKAEVMLRLKESATAVAGGGDCRRCQTLSAQVDALNHRVAALQQRAAVVAAAAAAAAAAAQPQRAPRRCRAARAVAHGDNDVEPSSDGSVRVVENAP